jgi:ADP-L-glycero-D-manno-heptose 6-epimerase
MQSVAAKIFPTVQKGGTISLFKSHREGIADGDQRRDFIYVKDVVSIILWFLENGRTGIFNVGTGEAKSFRQLAEAVFKALDRPAKIEYVDMPISIRDRYQYFTLASLDHLRQAGYGAPFKSLEDAVSDYVQTYLNTEDRYR